MKLFSFDCNFSYNFILLQVTISIINIDREVSESSRYLKLKIFREKWAATISLGLIEHSSHDNIKTIVLLTLRFSQLFQFEKFLLDLMRVHSIHPFGLLNHGSDWASFWPHLKQIGSVLTLFNVNFIVLIYSFYNYLKLKKNKKKLKGHETDCTHNEYTTTQITISTKSSKK